MMNYYKVQMLPSMVQKNCRQAFFILHVAHHHLIGEKKEILPPPPTTTTTTIHHTSSSPLRRKEQKQQEQQQQLDDRNANKSNRVGNLINDGDNKEDDDRSIFY